MPAQTSWLFPFLHTTITELSDRPPGYRFALGLNENHYGTLWNMEQFPTDIRLAWQMNHI